MVKFRQAGLEIEERAESWAGGRKHERRMLWYSNCVGRVVTKRHRRLPGDELVLHPKRTFTHAITINAPPKSSSPGSSRWASHRAPAITAIRGSSVCRDWGSRMQERIRI